MFGLEEGVPWQAVIVPVTAPATIVGEELLGICHIPRPCVAILSTCVTGWIAIPKTATIGKPVPKGTHVAPASVDA